MLLFGSKCISQCKTFPPKQIFLPFFKVWPKQSNTAPTSVNSYLITGTLIQNTSESDITLWFTTRQGRLREIYSTHSKTHCIPPHSVAFLPHIC